MNEEEILRIQANGHNAILEWLPNENLPEHVHKQLLEFGVSPLGAAMDMMQAAAEAAIKAEDMTDVDKAMARFQTNLEAALTCAYTLGKLSPND